MANETAVPPPGSASAHLNPANVTIHDLKIERNRLTDAIGRACLAFESHTGVRVESVNLGRVFDLVGPGLWLDVTVDIKLP